MSTKYIFVCGGVWSNTGKGIASCSIGLLLKLRGHKVNYLKLDGYLNPNSGILRPSEHGETFICDDASEIDLDAGSASRILGIDVSKKNIATSGSLYKQLIEEQEMGKYLGATCQVVPHITDLIQQKILDLGKDNDVVIIEIGGTVGDQESYAFFEAARQFKLKYRDDVLMTMVAPIPWVPIIQEFKTKPLQTSVRELQRCGLQVDVLFCRVDRTPPDSIIDKIVSMTGIKKNCIFLAPDVSTVYQVPIEFYDRQVDDLYVDLLRLNRSACRIHKYREVVEKYVNNDLPGVEIGIVGKYDNPDAYLSLKEALIHGGMANDVKVNINWIKAEELEKYKDNRGLHKYFEKLHGVIVPGGFDVRGTAGKIKAIEYVREKKIPFFGICLGLQCAVIEFARNELGLEDANSLEFNKNTQHPVVHYVEGQEGLEKKSGTMRLGSYDCELVKDSLVFELYGEKLIKERARHRCEINPIYTKQFEEKGFKVTGRNPGSNLIEIMELDRSIHPFFLAVQFHGEFKSLLTEPSPPFKGLIAAAVQKKKSDAKIPEVTPTI